MKIRIRVNRRRGEKGFALIMVLLAILVLSAVAASMAYLAMNETKVGGSDLRSSQTEYAAEAALEKLTAELETLYQSQQSPSISSIQGLAADVPVGADFTGINNVTWTGSITFPNCDLSGGRTTPCSTTGQIPAPSPNEGLQAVMVPMQVQVTATLAGGTTVNLTRQVEVALVPVFQFGVFSNLDTSFFAGPDYHFSGRIHTNANLYLAEGAGNTLTLTDKTSALGKIVRDYLPNGVANSASNHTGTVLAPTTALGCGTGTTVTTTASTACRALQLTTGTCTTVPNDAPEGSWQGGVAPDVSGTPAGVGSVNSNWHNISTGCYNSYLIDGTTNARKQDLAFVGGGVKPFEIIRQPPAPTGSVPAENPTGLIGGSRLFNMATIRVFLADNVGDLPYDSANYSSPANDPNNVPINIFFGSGNGTYNASGSTTGHYYWPPTGSITTAGGYWVPSPASTPDPIKSEYFAMGEWVTDGSGGSGSGIYGHTTPYIDCGSGAAITYPASYQALGKDQDWQQNSDNNSFSPGFRNGSGAVVSSTPQPQIALVQYACPGGTPLPTPKKPVRVYTFPLISGYLRVDLQTQDSSGNASVSTTGSSSGSPIYNGVTWQWLNLGFARGINTPTGGSSGSGTNPVDPNAILILQEWADHLNNGSGPSGSGFGSGGSGLYAGNVTGSGTQFNWFPINFYDAREGEQRDFGGSGSSSVADGAMLGIMNAVEIDVANLKKWITAMNTAPTGAAAGCRSPVNSIVTPTVPGEPACPSATPAYQANNGYILYFSDRRRMVNSVNASSTHPAGQKNGESLLEDTINPLSATAAANGGAPDAGEDVDQNGLLDGGGAANIGFGFPVATTNDVQVRVNILQDGRKYEIGGPREVLRLVNAGYVGGASSLPRSATGGGFTVASENPVYVWGSYNADNNLAPGDITTDVNSAPAAIIADAVTLLSDSWVDFNDHNSPVDASARNATTSYYRMAIAAGKNMSFPFASTQGAQVNDFGTDGGMHNFLRLLENWGGDTLNYEGSMVSLYYSQYAVGVYKGGGRVYSPPARNFQFDLTFQTLSSLPPGTPAFRDVNNIGFSQSFKPK